MTQTRARFAPTPSGYLHFGNLLNLQMTFDEVKKRGGEMALRIDDGDATRTRPEYIQDIFETLTWLGFTWDHGPKNLSDFTQNFSQSLKTKIYREFLKEFPGYACTCSRQEIKSRTRDHYDGHCRDKKLSLTKDQSQWRLLSDDPKTDVVLWRKENLPAYHLVSLYEDLQFQTNLIIRGEDLRESSEIQLMMAKMLGKKAQTFIDATFIHHPLILDEHQHKLSKSEGAMALKRWREGGKSAEDVMQELKRLRLSS
jgi:glutamyl/glutaminyl-tRNA synthetase